MIGMVSKEYIRKQHYVEETPIRQIARDTGHSRQYIRKVINKAVPTIPKYKLRQAKKRPVMDPFKDIITEWIIHDQTNPRKQRHNAARIYERLCEEYGFKGNDSTVRHYVRDLKIQLGLDKQEVFIPLEYELGSHAQCDWAEAEVILKGQRQKIYLFILKLSGSRDPFMMAFRSAKQEAFFEGHRNAFEYFGGVPRTIIYDNLKTAVARILQGKNRKEQNAFTVFKAILRRIQTLTSPKSSPSLGGSTLKTKKMLSWLAIPAPEKLIWQSPWGSVPVSPSTRLDSTPPRDW